MMGLPIARIHELREFEIDSTTTVVFESQEKLNKNESSTEISVDGRQT